MKLYYCACGCRDSLGGSIKYFKLKIDDLHPLLSEKQSVREFRNCHYHGDNDDEICEVFLL